MQEEISYLGKAPPEASGWKVELELLSNSGELQKTQILLSDAAIATSGDTYRYVELDGKRYSHIVDPHTGIGMTDRRKVTVIAPNGMEADALASALSVMDVDQGLRWINEHKGFEALIIKADHDLLVQFRSMNLLDFIPPK